MSDVVSPFLPLRPGLFRPSDQPWVNSPLLVGCFALPGESFRPHLINTDMGLCWFRVISPFLPLRPGSFRPGSFRPGSFRPRGGSFRPLR